MTDEEFQVKLEELIEDHSKEKKQTLIKIDTTQKPATNGYDAIRAIFWSVCVFALGALWLLAPTS